MLYDSYTTERDFYYNTFLRKNIMLYRPYYDINQINELPSISHQVVLFIRLSSDVLKNSERHVHVQKSYL